MAARGLLRVTSFIRQFLGAVREQQEYRTTESPSLWSPEMRWEDVCVTLFMAIILFTLRRRLESTVFNRFFANFKGQKRRQLGENLFYSVYYSIAFSFYLFCLRPSIEWSAPLFSNKNVIVRQLVDPFPPPMNWQEHFYYSQAMGFYIAGTIFLLKYDQRRSDYSELLIHHVVTLSLVAVSYVYGYIRVGIVVLALHDVGDILLYSAKFFHYLGFSGLDTVLFGFFAVTFYVTRMLMYARIVYAVAAETLATVVEEPAFNNWAMFYDTYLIHYLFFVVFLGTLLVLHCFWFALILRMIYREVALGLKITEEGDIRSDDEDE